MPGTVPGFGGDDNDDKTGLCSQEPLGVFSAANHTNKPALARRWLLINSPLEVAYVSFGDLIIQRRAAAGVQARDRPVGEVSLGTRA